MLQMFDDGCDDLRGTARARFVAQSFLGLVLHAGRVEGLDAPSSEQDRSVALFVADLGQDIWIACRSLRRRPGFSVTVLCTLVLGIGINSSIFSLVNGLLLRPLPYDDPGRLVQLSETSPDIESMDLSLPDFDLWREETRVLDGVFAFDDAGFVLQGPAGAELLEGAVVSPGFLAVLGVEPILGRNFATVEEMPGEDGVALISARLWGEMFGFAPDVLGREITLNGRSRVIMGVAPSGFHFPEVADLWVPLAFDPATADPEDYGYDAIGRLKGGYGVDDALVEGERIAGQLAAAHPDTKRGIGTDAYPLRLADVPAEAALASLLLLAAVTLVLLVACANVAGLMLSRGEERRAELATRRALGASRARVVRQLLTESLVLGGIGSCLALAVTRWSGALFNVLLPEERPFWVDFPIDGRVVAWTLGASLLAAVLSGLGPAVHVARGQAGLGHTAGRRVTGRGRSVFVVSQLAVATMLVVLAGAAVEALRVIGGVDPGVEPDGVLVLDLILPPWDFPESADVVRGADAALQAATGLREVNAAALVTTVPFVGSGIEVALDLQAAPGGGLRPVGVLNGVTEGYFGAMGIDMVSGRGPTRTEARAGAPVAVLSETLARRLWPDGEAIGRRLRHSEPGARTPNVSADSDELVVIGVANDVRQRGPGRPARGELYVPWSRLASAGITVVVRADGVAGRVAGDLQARLETALPGVVFREPATMTDVIGASVWTERVTSRLLAGLAALGTLLAALGINGLVAFTTARRAREIGLRVALGASIPTLRATVVGGALKLILPGLAVGLLAGLAALELVRPFFLWLPARDWMSPVVAAIGFALVGVGAAYLPTRKLTARDGMIALRAE